MTKSKGTLRTCKRGHKFYKSSDCPVCPVCEKDKKPSDGFLSLLGAPARRALERENIKTPKHLAKYTEQEILALHGLGKSTITTLKALLQKNNLSFKDAK